VGRFWDTLARLIVRWRFVTWGLALVAVIVAAFGIPRIQFDTQQDTLVSPNSQVFRDNVQFQKLFGGGQLAVIFDGNVLNLLQGENLVRLEQLDQRIKSDPRFLNVTSPDTLLNQAEVQVPAQVQQQAATVAALQKTASDAARAKALAAGKTAAEAQAAGDAAGSAAIQAFIQAHAAEAKQFAAVGALKKSNPKFVQFVLEGPDGKLRPEVTGLVPDLNHSLLIANIRGNMSVNEQNRAASDIKTFVREAGFQGITSTVTGEQLLLTAISNDLRGSIPELSIISLTLMVVIVLTVFRARWRLLHLPVVFLAMAIALGLIGFAHLPLTMASTAGLPILVGLSVDFGIQFHNRYEEEFDEGCTAAEALRRSLRGVGPALFTALVAACLGFAALRYSAVPMLQDFSSVLSVGIAVVFIICLFVLNGVLVHRDRRRQGVAAGGEPPSFIERVLARTYRATVVRPLPILILGALIALGGFVVDHRIATETEPNKFIPANSQVLKDITRLEDLTATANTIDFLVTARDVTSPEVLTWMNNLGQAVAAKDSRVTGTNSLVTLLTAGTSGPPDFSPKAVTATLATTSPDIVGQFVTPAHTAADFSFTIARNVTLLQQQTVIDEITQMASPPPGVTIAPAGMGVIGVAAESQLTSHRLSMTFLALAAVLVLLLAFTRSARLAVIAVLPVGLAIGWTSAAMYVLAVPLNPLTAISGPLVVALGTEFSIILMLRYREELRRGLLPGEAMERAYLRSGRAITASALTVMGAFLALAFNNFPLLSQFGIISVIGVTLSLAGGLLLMPPLLVWADETFAPRLPAEAAEPVEPR